MRVIRIVLGVVVGYAVMVVLITLVQEAWLGGVSYHESSVSELLLAGIGTFLSAVAGGAAGTAIAGSGTRAVGVGMSVVVVVETTALVATGKIGGPLWFDLGGSASLIVGIVIGTELVRRWAGRD